MHRSAIKQRFTILSQEDAVRRHRQKFGHWNVISISDYGAVPVEFPAARKLLRLGFHDVTGDYPEEGQFAATADDVRAALEFSRQAETGPLLIHCYAGISRSTALAWILIWDKLKGHDGAVREAFELVRELWPILQPNQHILRLGIEILAPETQRSRVTEQFRHCLFELNLCGPKF